MTDNLIFNEYQGSAMAEQYMGDDVMQISKHFSVIDDYLYYDGENTGMYLRGNQGLQGERGERGLSAYDVAVVNGFEGDETSWLEGLKGERGSDAPLPHLTVSAYNASEPEATLTASATETGNNIWNFRFGIPAGMPLVWNPADNEESDDELPEEDTTVIILTNQEVATPNYEEELYSSDSIEIVTSENVNSSLQANHNYEVIIKYTPSGSEAIINLGFHASSTVDNSGEIVLTHNFEADNINIIIKYYEEDSNQYYQIFSTVSGDYNIAIYDEGPVVETEEEPEESGTGESEEENNEDSENEEESTEQEEEEEP